MGKEGGTETHQREHLRAEEEQHVAQRESYENRREDHGLILAPSGGLVANRAWVHLRQQASRLFLLAACFLLVLYREMSTPPVKAKHKKKKTREPSRRARGAVRTTLPRPDPSVSLSEREGTAASGRGVRARGVRPCVERQAGASECVLERSAPRRRREKVNSPPTAARQERRARPCFSPPLIFFF